MPEIVLCPKCQVRVGRDKSGELLCPKCGVRLCPKAHIVEGKICSHCGWVDPNYFLWQRARKAQAKRSEVEKSGQFLDSKPQRVCPRCGIIIEGTSGRCSGCGWLYGSKPRVSQQSETDIIPKLKSEPRRLTSSPYEPISSTPSQSGTPAQSPLVYELRKLRHREWNFTPIKRFLQPVGASLLVCAVLFGGFILVKEVIVPVFSQPAGKASPQTMPIPISSPAKFYTLNKKAMPEGGGRIDVSPPSESGTFESGTPITLTAIPDECYTFNYWEGITSESSEAIITMDSNKSVTANFRLKDTTSPAISEVKVSRCSDISATITWKTDEPAKGQVEYGKTAAYGQSASLGAEFATSHAVPLRGLEPNTDYYFKVMSEDTCGNEADTVSAQLRTSHIIPVGHEVGKRAPGFTLPSYQDDNLDSPNKGQTVSLSDFRGKKILLNFWNTFCGACIGEFPAIRGTYYDEDCRQNEGAVALITVCIDTRIDEASGRIEKLEAKYKDAEDKVFGKIGNLTFPILLDIEGEAKKNYNVWSIPCSVFIDSDGIIQHVKIGRFTSMEEIQSIFDSLE